MKRNTNTEQKYALCVFLEDKEEQKTVVPKRWVDEDKKILWWPRGINVVSKKFCDPNKDTWEKYELLKVLVEGEEGLCYEIMGETSSSASEGENQRRKKFPRNSGEESGINMPRKPSMSVVSLLTKSKDNSFSNGRSTSLSLSRSLVRSESRHIDTSPILRSRSSSRSRSPSPSRSRHDPSRRYNSSMNSNSRSRSPSRSPSRSNPRRQLSTSTHSSSRSCSPCTISDSRLHSTISRPCSPYASSAVIAENGSFDMSDPVKRKDSARSVKQKFPMDQGEFQRRVLTLLVSGPQAKRLPGCQCPCTCGKNETSLIDSEFPKLWSLKELDDLERIIKDQVEYQKLVATLKKVGGKDVKDNVRNTMYRIMDGSVMEKFNMKGKNRGDAKKLGFERKRLCEAIVESVQALHKDATMADIKVLIANVLKFAPFCNGGAKQKKGGKKSKRSRGCLIL